MRRHDLLSSSVLLCFGLAIVAASPQFGLGTAGAPGSGFWPLLTGVVICAFSAATFLTALRDTGTRSESIWTGVRFPRLAFAVAALVAYGLLLTKLGFIICSAAMLLVLLRGLGSQTWRTSITVACAGTLVSYLVFETWFRANLPRGLLGF